MTNPIEDVLYLFTYDKKSGFKRQSRIDINNYCRNLLQTRGYYSYMQKMPAPDIVKPSDEFSVDCEVKTYHAVYSTESIGVNGKRLIVGVYEE